MLKVKALLGKRAKTGGKVKTTKAPEYEKSYRWKDNSCWLDSSLTLISAAVARDYPLSMEPMFSDLPANHALRDLRQMMYTRVSLIDLAGYEPGGSNLLGQQRDGFRQLLVNMPRLAMGSMQDFSSMFGWLYHIIDPRGPQLTPGVERAVSYFRMSSVILKTCKGSSENHWQLSKIKPRSESQLHSELCKLYGGDLRKWFQDFVRVSKSSPLAACWHTQDGNVLCTGSAIQHEVILNLPVALIIEIGDMRASNWNIPGTLSPYASNPAASAVGLKYSIVGHIYCHMGAKHFIARYLTVFGSKEKVFDYDGMKNEGHAVRNRTTKMQGSLTGPSHSLVGLPDGYLVYAVLYHLDGGEKAQKFFRGEQLTQATKLGLHFDISPSSQTGIPSKCELRLPDIARIPDNHRFWLRGQNKPVDYIQPRRQSSPRKASGWHAPMKISVPSEPEDDNDSLDEMLMDAIESRPPKKVKARGKQNSKAAQAPNSTSKPPSQPSPQSESLPEDASGVRSTTPSPVWCNGCGMQQPEGDDDPNEVQCEVCKFWSHEACLPSELDWNDPDVHFICSRCRNRQRLESMFHPGDIVMVPDPNVPDWRAPGVLWYPAKFIKWHEDQPRKPKEYEFRWLACTDGVVFHSATSDAPLLVQRMFHRGREFCEEITNAKLNKTQIGTIRMPFFMNPDHEKHQNLELAEIFEAAIPPIAKILAAFSNDHPVVASYNKHLVWKPDADRRGVTVTWMRTLGLVENPELEALLEAALPRFLPHSTLNAIPFEERRQRVSTVSSALLQLLAVQHALGEPLNLNGDILDDLCLGDDVVPFECDGPQALSHMFSHVAPAVNNLAAHMLKFNRAHVFYNPDFRPPTFRREDNSHTEPTPAIPVPLKRKQSVDPEDQPQGKRAKAKGVRMQRAPTTTRTLRSLVRP